MEMLINEPTAARRRIYGTIIGTDGITRVTTKGGEAARKIVNGVDSGSWTATLTHIGSGEYYCELTQAETAAQAEGDVISWGYKAADTSEAIADRVQFVTVRSAAIQSGILELREGNTRKTFVVATTAVLARKVAVGRINYILLETKADAAADWSAPTSTKYLYFHYATSGDINPTKIGETA